MKKNIATFIIVGLLALVMTSCVSSVNISTMVPSQVDLTGYSSIRVEEPSVRGVISSYDKKSITSQTRDMIVNALAEGTYTVVASGRADAVLSSDVVIDPNRSYVVFQETDKTDKDGNKIFRFYLRQSALFVFSYTLRDSKTGAILDSYSTKVGMPSIGYEETYLGESTDSEDKTFMRYSYTYGDYIGGYSEAIQSLKNTIITRLVPHTKTVSISLMENKPEVENLKGAYEAVDNGLYREALLIFDTMWNRYGYVQAGYNSALLYYATGNQDKAIERAYQVWTKTENSKALTLYSKLKGLKTDDALAKSQSGI